METGRTHKPVPSIFRGFLLEQKNAAELGNPGHLKNGNTVRHGTLVCFVAFIVYTPNFHQIITQVGQWGLTYIHTSTHAALRPQAM